MMMMLMIIIIIIISLSSADGEQHQGISLIPDNARTITH